MGAQQSSQDGGAGTTDSLSALPRKTCYYELLGVERTADEADIRKAYKKKALELHPDRNYNDEEAATKKFAEVQTAYEVLSDPQERAWYDSHRDAILRGDDDVDDGAPSEHYNVRLTTTEEILSLIGRFNSRVPFNDSPTGFFGILNITFEHLSMEEAAASEYDNQEPIDYPPFGTANDTHQTTAKPFYTAWTNFSTRKSFSWKEKWRLSEAPDRRVRRLMEKENKKIREDAIRDFNDAVRSLVAFVKKRDPRYVPNTQSEAERQKILRESAATQAARARAANQEKLAKSQAFVVPQWAQSRDEDQMEFDNEFATSEEESEVEEFECVVCNKIFKSEKQFEAHEKSKKHLKAVQQLKRQMKKEGHDLDLDVEESTRNVDPSPRMGSPSGQESMPEDEARPISPTTSTKGTDDLAGEEAASSSEDVLDDEYAPREVVEGRLAADDEVTDSANKEQAERLASKAFGMTIEDSENDQKPAPKQIGRAKAKRAKKAAYQNPALKNRCGVCDEVFDSRTKLFNHIKDKDHAQPQMVHKTDNKGKKSKR
ncbi:hypothetical protein N0V82_008905 [Gnomoniopsis sp. IMI 355080]|nr:hypothetical protein N0V82_008905 [Gnomoniopsis sp. IMI 355080]